jgi:hypothetical protein
MRYTRDYERRMGRSRAVGRAADVDLATGHNVWVVRADVAGRTPSRQSGARPLTISVNQTLSRRATHSVDRFRQHGAQG